MAWVLIEGLYCKMPVSYFHDKSSHNGCLNKLCSPSYSTNSDSPLHGSQWSATRRLKRKIYSLLISPLSFCLNATPMTGGHQLRHCSLLFSKMVEGSVVKCHNAHQCMLGGKPFQKEHFKKKLPRVKHLVWWHQKIDASPSYESPSSSTPFPLK